MAESQSRGSRAKKTKKKRTTKKKAAKRKPARKTRSQGRKTARQKHLENAFRLAMTEDNVEEALVEMRKALEGERPGPRSGAHDVLLREAYGWGYQRDTHTDIAAHLGISRDTWRLWRKERPELQAEWERGRAKLGTDLRRKVLQHANSGDTRMLKYAANNFAGMANTVRHEVDMGDQSMTVNFVAANGSPLMEKALAIDEAEEAVRFDGGE